MNRIELARQLDYIREAEKENTGLRVEGIQRWGGGHPGDSWCCFWATMVLDIEFKGNAPIPRLGACEDVHQLAKQNGRILDKPELGCLVLSVTQAGHAHHIGIVTSLDPLTSIAGNTSKDGQSSNGDGVYEHPVSPNGKVFVKVLDGGQNR